MGTKLHYKPGSFYRICDRTGFAVRAEESRKEWTNEIVRTRSFEARQPQDFVRGRRDDQTVPEPRPRQANIFIGPQTTTLTTNAAARATSIIVQTVSLFSSGNQIAIMMDNGIEYVTTVSGAPVGSTVNLAGVLPASAASGNIVTNNSSPELSQSGF